MFPVRPDDKDGEENGVGVEEKGDVKDEQDEEGEVEEAKVAKPARDPGAPTRAEIEAHEPTHLPFRSWCPTCIAGRRDNPPHKRREDEERQVPEVMLDYGFVRPVVYRLHVYVSVVQIQRVTNLSLIMRVAICCPKQSTYA